jgi:hypothetical protein
VHRGTVYGIYFRILPFLKTLGGCAERQQTEKAGNQMFSHEVCVLRFFANIMIFLFVRQL